MAFQGRSGELGPDTEVEKQELNLWGLREGGKQRSPEEDRDEWRRRARCWAAPGSERPAWEGRCFTQRGRGQCSAPGSRMQGRINLAGVSGENIDLKCSAVF